MNKMITIAGLAISVSALTASAEVLLEIDLSVVDQITISATGGLSAVTASGSDFTGVYLDGLFGADGTLVSSLVSGDLTNAENPSDGSPALFRASSGTDTGLNIWSFSSDSIVTFTAGSLAFTGSATFDLDSLSYANLLAGNTSGDIYFPADSFDDIAGGAVSLGTYFVIPAPSSLALLGLGGMVCARRRR